MVWPLVVPAWPNVAGGWLGATCSWTWLVVLIDNLFFKKKSIGNDNLDGGQVRPALVKTTLVGDAEEWWGNFLFLSNLGHFYNRMT